jgi:uncharacterized membrane protein
MCQATYLTCRVFYINIPVVVIVLFGIWFFLTLKTDTSSVREKLKRIDYIGIIVFVGSATSFLFGLTAGGVMFPWNSANVVAPLVLGVFGLVGFWFIEDYLVKEPMMPMRVFKERTAFASYIGTWVHGIILWSIIYYLLLWVTLTSFQANIRLNLSLSILLFEPVSMLFQLH